MQIARLRCENEQVSRCEALQANNDSIRGATLTFHFIISIIITTIGQTIDSVCGKQSVYMSSGTHCHDYKYLSMVATWNSGVVRMPYQYKIFII